MTRPCAVFKFTFASFLYVAAAAAAQAQFPGFDRNDYPGDAALPALRQSFRYTSYWLNPPPGESTNSWSGKHAILKQQGFGFLVLFTGRTDAQLKGQDAAVLGQSDANTAVAAALHEGFPRGVLIFLDQEEGGRLLPEQAVYVFAWIDAVRAAGARAGVYCSGIEAIDASGTTSTAEDILARETARHADRATNERHRKVALWIADDACPPAPGCTLAAPPMTSLSAHLRPFATVWQYAQSPRRAQFSANCPKNTAADGNCYAPGLPPGANSFVDLDTALSPDPSSGR